MGSTCPICFDDLTDKVKASPDSCDHVFCLLCLEKWSKLGSYCPVDRKRYKKIVNLDSENVIQVKPRKRKKARVVYDFSTKCEFCEKDDSPNTLLLCDCCDLGFHSQCLSPPLEVIPAGLWYCPECIAVEENMKKRKGITKEVEADMGNVNKKLHFSLPEKQSSVEVNNLKSSYNKVSENVVKASNDISLFEDINIVKEQNKDTLNTDINQNSFGNARDKIFETFDAIPESIKSDVFLKISKTYLRTSKLSTLESLNSNHSGLTNSACCNDLKNDNADVGSKKICSIGLLGCYPDTQGYKNTKSVIKSEIYNVEKDKETSKSEFRNHACFNAEDNLELKLQKSISKIKERNKLSLNRRNDLTTTSSACHKEVQESEQLLISFKNDFCNRSADHKNDSECMLPENRSVEEEDYLNPVDTFEEDAIPPSMKLNPEKSTKGPYSLRKIRNYFQSSACWQSMVWDQSRYTQDYPSNYPQRNNFLRSSKRLSRGRYPTYSFDDFDFRESSSVVPTSCQSSESVENSSYIYNPTVYEENFPLAKKKTQDCASSSSSIFSESYNLLQTSTEAVSASSDNDKNEPIYKSDLKQHLVILSDGTFFLDLKKKQGIQKPHSLTTSYNYQNSASAIEHGMYKLTKCKELVGSTSSLSDIDSGYETSINGSVKGENHEISNSEENLEESDSYCNQSNSCQSFYLSDLKRNLKISSDGTFFLDLNAKQINLNEKYESYVSSSHQTPHASSSHQTSSASSNHQTSSVSSSHQTSVSSSYQTSSAYSSHQRSASSSHQTYVSSSHQTSIINQDVFKTPKSKDCLKSENSFNDIDSGYETPVNNFAKEKILDEKYKSKGNLVESGNSCGQSDSSKSFYLSDLKRNLRIRTDGTFYLDVFNAKESIPNTKHQSCASIAYKPSIVKQEMFETSESCKTFEKSMSTCSKNDEAEKTFIKQELFETSNYEDNYMDYEIDSYNDVNAKSLNFNDLKYARNDCYESCNLDLRVGECSSISNQDYESFAKSTKKTLINASAKQDMVGIPEYKKSVKQECNFTDNEKDESFHLDSDEKKTNTVFDKYHSSFPNESQTSINSSEMQDETQLFHSTVKPECSSESDKKNSLYLSDLKKHLVIRDGVFFLDMGS